MAVIGRQEFDYRAQNAAPAGRPQANLAVAEEPVLVGNRHSADPAPARANLLLRFVEIGLVLVFGVLLALIALKLLAPLPLPQGDRAAGLAAPAQSGPLVVKNPFPTAEIAPIFEEAAPTVADTTLDLTLTGVWVEAAGGSATIKTPDGKQGRYAVGDEIVNGVRLDAVYADQVIINRSGVRESLRFESKTAGAGSPSTLGARRPAAQAQPSAAQGAPLRGGPTSVTSSLSGKISEFMRLAPATDSDGNLVIDIYAARDRQTFNAYGLKDGDRLVSVNGLPPPTNPAALRAAMNALQRDSQAVFIVRRDGQEIPVTLRLD